MNLFATYEPRVRSSLNYHVQLIPADRSHVTGIAKLIADRNDIDIDLLIRKLSNAFEKGERELFLQQIFVAMYDDQVVGYGKCKLMVPDEIEGAFGLPEGWYLMGTIVDPRYRRQGIGRRLVQARLRWIREMSNYAYYYVNSMNEASIRLHADFGFKEISRTFGFPGLSFKGGKGILFEAKLSKAVN